jgi:hypothetical protein
LNLLQNEVKVLKIKEKVYFRGLKHEQRPELVQEEQICLKKLLVFNKFRCKVKGIDVLEGFCSLKTRKKLVYEYRLLLFEGFLLLNETCHGVVVQFIELSEEN